MHPVTVLKSKKNSEELTHVHESKLLQNKVKFDNMEAAFRFTIGLLITCMTPTPQATPPHVRDVKAPPSMSETREFTVKEIQSGVKRALATELANMSQQFIVPHWLYVMFDVKPKVDWTVAERRD